MKEPIDKNSGPVTLEQRTIIKPSSILFVCNHNVIRSPMGEQLAKKLLPRTVFVQSAGVYTGSTDGFVTAIMQELDCSMEGHESKSLDDIEDSYFDLIVTLSPTAHHVALQQEIIRATDIIYWPSADPTVVQGSREQKLEAYRTVRDRLKHDIETNLMND